MTHPEPPLLEARGVIKAFGDFLANDRVDLVVKEGEKHALLGENGAGKSTLVKMIYGALRPTAGEFLWKGQPLRLNSPAEARALGIGMVFQHFSVFEGLSVLENIALALPPEPHAHLATRIREVSAAYGLPVDPDKPLSALSVGERQRVEILRCLLQNPKLLIMDEPTSVLTPQEATQLFGSLDRLAGEGCAILYISHRLEEVRALCQNATILRRGKVVGRMDPRTISAREMAAMMVGADIADVRRAPAAATGQEVFRVEKLSLPAESQFGVSLRDVTLSLKAGRVLGVAGVAGEGQTELMAALTGERRAPEANMISLKGKPVGRMGPVGRREAGAAFSPEERNGHGAVGAMRLSENMFISRWREFTSASGFMKTAEARAETARIRAAFDVRSASEDPVAGSLSGGNLQKFLMGREISRKPVVMIAAQPTWGVDAGATAAIRQALIDLASAGAGVIVISQDLDEIFEVSDEIAVMSRGRLSPAYPAADMTAEKLGLLMAGSASQEG